MKPFADTNEPDDCGAAGCDRACARPATCPLSRVEAGVSVRIKELSTSPEVAQRLREIGFGEQQVVRLLGRQSNLICLVCNARLAVSSSLAQLILVEPLAA